MTTKQDRDWEAIERDYRSGQFTDRELGEKYGISHTAIQKRAKRHGWQKNLAGAVKAATNARLIEAEVAKVASQGIEPKVVQVLLGHSDLEMTQLYLNDRGASAKKWKRVPIARPELQPA